jgi:ABC-type transporter Mla subunit MlaD
MATATNSELYKDVVKLKSDMAQINVLVDRIDVTIEKLTEVSKNISELLAVQANRLEFQEKITQQLSVLMEKRRDESEENIRYLREEIEKVEKDLNKVLDEKYHDILDEIKSIRDNNSKQHQQMQDKFSQFERWMWMVSGGAVIIAFLLSKIAPIKIF